MIGAPLGSAVAVPALVRVWLASLMSPGRAAPALLLYFATPATPAPSLRGALAVPSLREGWGVIAANAAINPLSSTRAVKEAGSGAHGVAK